MRALPLWLPDYLRRRPPLVTRQPVDILFCICDHFEPRHHTDAAGAQRRLAFWREHYPRLRDAFRDADGFAPRHTFFYPIEQYDEKTVAELARWEAAGWGEIEMHLHHDQDTAESLCAKLIQGRDRLAAHGLLSKDAAGRTRYAFIHGNWALDNSDPRRINCGVNTELTVLRTTGCYADFTMPSAPHPTQTRIVNALYYAFDTPQPKSHDYGQPVAVNPQAIALRGAEIEHVLLMVQGPLALNWQRRKYGCLPRLENGELAGNHPPTPERMQLWLKQVIHVVGRPEWVFIKLYTHGCDEERGNLAMLLGEPMRAFHAYLAEHYNDGLRYRLHYVTAREMVNILHAAEDGRSGNAGAFRDYCFVKHLTRLAE